ncbi:MAG: transporter substrate-binding domain-containing protein [Anabaena sp. CoA2_C59]|nr:transporter substrate-binding domain-containing protein [Anabaena sp. CoA2_C59]MDJ0505298.1 transporter substrate-binding domain-containing protein [Nostocales cyanobacterium LE14-WE12]
MKLNYLPSNIVIVSILFLSHASFAQNSKVTETLFFGLRNDTPPLSYRGISLQWSGYCPQLLEHLKERMNKNNPQKEISIVYKQVSLNNRFTGKGDDGTPLDGECGANTITNEREAKLTSIDAGFSNSFAWTGAKLLLKNINKASFYNPEPFKEKTIGIPGIKTTTNSLIGSIYKSATIKQVTRGNAFNELDDNKIIAYAADELILKEMLKERENENLKNSQQYSIVPYFKPLSHEPYGIVIYNKSKNQNFLNEINSFLTGKEAEELRKNNHLDDTQDNFLEKLYEINYYDSRFLIEIFAVSILLTFCMLLFLKKLIPTRINRKVLDVLNKEVNKLKNSDKQSDHLFLTIITLVEKIVVNYQKGSKYDQRNGNIQFVDTPESGSKVIFDQDNYTPEEQKQKLKKVEEEIQKLLKQLEETNPSATKEQQISHTEDNTTVSS